MQLSFLSEQNGYSDELEAGFRLQRFEVYNWGHFNQGPWIVNLAGKTGLLTGINGSGKTTLVDGLLTLFVPNRKRNYNQASVTTERKDRDEQSYVLGAYGGTFQEEFYVSKSNYLRKEGDLTVLLGYFLNEMNQKKVTLAQVLWIKQGNIKRLFIIAEDELSIANHFKDFKYIADLKKRFKTENIETFEEFNLYSQKFIKLFGLNSEKALDLFNQAVGMKRIDKINDFVRNQMLEKAEIQKNIKELLDSYQNLTVCHEKIKEAREQLDILTPLQELAENLTKVKQEIATLQRLRQIAPAYFAQQKLVLVAQKLQKIKQQLIQSEHDQQECKDCVEDLDKRKTQLYSDIENNSIGQRLNQLTQDINQCKKEVGKRQDKAANYNSLAQNLNLPQYKDSATFFAAREQGESLKGEIDEAFKHLQVQRDQQVIQHEKLKEQKTELEDNLEDLRKHRSQINKKNREIRERLVRELNLNETEIPFIGELLQVSSEAKEWEGAIERLLHSFGLSVLVPEHLYVRVNNYVEKTNLRGCLVYYRVKPSTPNPTQRPFETQKVPHKLEIKSDNNMFSDWLREQLLQRFNYVCCYTLEQFERETRAITRNGLIKGGGERHEKDDSSQIGDRSKYILGWNNIEKIKAFEAELNQVNQQFSNIDKQKKALESQIQQHEKKKSGLQNFMNFTDFTEIDWQSIQSECDNLEREQQELEANSEPLKQLRKQLEQVQQQIKDTNNKKDKLLREIEKLEIRQQNYKAAQSECENKLKQFSLQQIEEFETWITGQEEQKQLVLDTIDKTETEIIQKLSNTLKQEEEKQTKFETEIKEQIYKFWIKFKEMTADLGTSIESLQEYLNLKTKIEHEDLHRHEKHFKEFMNDKIINAVSSFQTSLNDQKKAIIREINLINKSLYTINYTDLTYIKLGYKETHDQDIRGFIKDLRICISNLAARSAEENEERFKNIESLLIERFKNDERWTKKVTDVRNWLEFSVSELYQEDNKEKEYYTDSTGKSGGEKTKLAYTIFAASISYEFGINQENWGNKSLRFMVIDEVFSKLDTDNALYAINLFKQLNLQVLFVTPQDKINLIEPYIATLNFVWPTKNSEQPSSNVHSIPIEEYKHKKESVLSDKND